MKTNSNKLNSKIINLFMNNSVALTIIGAVIQNNSVKEYIYFKEDQKKIGEYFEKIKKDKEFNDKFPRFLDKVVLDSCYYSSSIQRGLDLFIEKDLIGRDMAPGRYWVNKKKINSLYHLMSKDKKEIINEIAKRFNFDLVEKRNGSYFTPNFSNLF